ncbi:hypothetical protein C4Q31_14065 [Leptospira borgpetersenii serovar Ceylonica]|nr:hypothetical protein C4Q31_14065 [Leptospira borgpetersenii serovar Ceylonica]
MSSWSSTFASKDGAPVNKLYERNVMQYFVFSYNLLWNTICRTIRKLSEYLSKDRHSRSETA